MKVLHMITIMISTVSTIGTYPMLDTNTIHKKRPSTLCTRSFLCMVLMFITVQNLIR